MLYEARTRALMLKVRAEIRKQNSHINILSFKLACTWLIPILIRLALPVGVLRALFAAFCWCHPLVLFQLKSKFLLGLLRNGIRNLVPEVFDQKNCEFGARVQVQGYKEEAFLVFKRPRKGALVRGN